MLDLLTLEIQNFKSFGEKKTVIDFRDYPGLTLFIGKDDDSLSPDKRNGCGKSSIMDALSFAFTGEPIKKTKSKNTLVNKINGKKAFITLNFTLHNDLYRIERGLKPGTLDFYRKPENDPRSLEECKETRSTMAETQAYIESITRLDANIVRILLISATKTPNFFEMESSDQKKIVEKLFGFENLTVKAAAIKEVRQKAEIVLQLENTKIQEKQLSRNRFVAQLEAVRAQSAAWENSHTQSLDRLNLTVSQLPIIDRAGIVTKLEEYQALASDIQTLKVQRATGAAEAASIKATVTSKEAGISVAQRWLDQYDATSITAFIDGHAAYAKAATELTSVMGDLRELSTEAAKLSAEVTKKKAELHSIADNCPTCGQTWPDQAARQEKIDQIKADIAENTELLDAIIPAQAELEQLKATLQKTVAPHHPLFATTADAQRAQYEFEARSETVANLTKELADVNLANLAAIKTLADLDESISLLDNQYKNRENLPYGSINEVDQAIASQTKLMADLDSLKASVNPHTDTLTALTSETVDDIDTATRDGIEDDIRHYVYMEKLLTRKDSPIRRIVITKKLPKLNEFMAHYLTKLDLPYTVTFEDDLTASIMHFDIEMDFSDLSSGEEERVAMALSWAFRDVFEDINFPINFIGIDERIDAGLCGAGVESAMQILQEMALNRGRKTFLVSHKKEMADHVDRIVLVRKKGNFSQVEAYSE